MTPDELVGMWRRTAVLLKTDVDAMAGLVSPERVNGYADAMETAAAQLADVIESGTIYEPHRRHAIGPDGVCVRSDCDWTAADEAADHAARRGLWNHPPSNEAKAPVDPPCARCGHAADDHSNRPGVDVGWPCWHVEGDPCTCTRYVRPTK